MMRKTSLRGSARMTTVWPENKYYYLQAWQSPEKNEPQTLIEALYSTVDSKWNVFMKEL